MAPAMAFPLHSALTAAPHPGAMTRPSPKRRLTDKLRAVFHAACDDGDTLISERVLNLLVKQVVKPPHLPASIDRRRQEDLAGPCERLANLQVRQKKIQGG